MSTARDDRDDERDERPVSRKPLTTREVLDLYLNEPAVRPYLFGALGGLAMTFLILFMNGSDIGGVVVVLFGLSALLLRWIASPIFVVLVTAYFQVFPFGIPDDLYNDPYNVRRTHFQVQDVMLVAAVLVYLRCTYRVLGLVHQSMPFENVFRRKGEYPTRRPVGHIEPGEIGWLLGASVGLVILGQSLWWLVNALDFVPTEGGVPFRWADLDDASRYRRSAPREAGEYSAPMSRFFVLTGALFFGFLLVRSVFGYWRLRMMTAAEGAMVTTDTSWAESHRERVRVEKWRIWGREKEAEKERRARREEREKRRKEDDKREKAERKAREREREEMEERARRRRRERDEDDDDRPRRRR